MKHAPHEHHVVTGICTTKGDAGWFARCWCGWREGGYTFRSTAEDDALQHLVAMEREAFGGLVRQDGILSE
jgi:hypothetical protein